MPRPRSLTRDQIAAAALAVIDRGGLLEGFSMRAVADELGVGTMSLYRYVRDREDLERLVVDDVLRGINLELPSAAPWTKRVTLLLERARDAVEAHPSVAPLLLIHRHAAANSRRFGEALLGVLSAAGFTGKRRVTAFRSLVSYLFGALQYQRLGPLSGKGTGVLAQLPADRYPFLSATARDAQRMPPREEFRRGVEVLLRGLQR